MPCYTVNPSKLPHMCIARFPLSTNIAMEHPPCWWYLPVKKRLSWAMFVSGKVIQWPLFKIIKETSSQRSTIHLAHCPSLDITLHFTLEVVHELMQQQQTSSRQVRHILPFPTAKTWNIHPFHTYVTLRFKISMAQIEMFKRNCKQESSNGQNTTPQMNLAVFNPIIWSEYVRIFLGFISYSRVKILSINKIIIRCFRCFCCILTIFIKVNQLKDPQKALRFWIWSKNIFTTRRNSPLKPIS